MSLRTESPNAIQCHKIGAKNKRAFPNDLLPRNSLQVINKNDYLFPLLTTSAGLSGPSEAVAIKDCWIWQIATENLFSKSLISQRQLFAPANNSRKKISLPHRHRLKGTGLGHKQKNRRESHDCRLFPGLKDKPRY